MDNSLPKVLDLLTAFRKPLYNRFKLPVCSMVMYSISRLIMRFNSDYWCARFLRKRARWPHFINEGEAFMQTVVFAPVNMKIYRQVLFVHEDKLLYTVTSQNI